MIAGATEVPVVGRAFLSTVGWADAAVHVENDLLRRATVMNAVDPSAGKITKRGEVFLGGQNLRLEAPHLTARGRLFGDGMAADDPPHDRVEAEPVGIVHVVVAAKASENGLAELADHAMPPVHAGTTVGKNIANHLSKFNGGIKLSIGEQTGVSSDLGPVELKLESTVKIDPKAPLFRFTHRVCHIR